MFPLNFIIIYLLKSKFNKLKSYEKWWRSQSLGMCSYTIKTTIDLQKNYKDNLMSSFQGSAICNINSFR